MPRQVEDIRQTSEKKSCIVNWVPRRSSYESIQLTTSWFILWLGFFIKPIPPTMISIHQVTTTAPKKIARRPMKSVVRQIRIVMRIATILYVHEQRVNKRWWRMGLREEEWKDERVWETCYLRKVTRVIGKLRAKREKSLELRSTLPTTARPDICWIAAG